MGCIGVHHAKPLQNWVPERSFFAMGCTWGARMGCTIRFFRLPQPISVPLCSFDPLSCT